MTKLDDNFDAAVGDAAFHALRSVSAVKNANYRTSLGQLDLDSLKVAEVCAEVQSYLRQKGYDVDNDVVDHSVQDAVVDTNASVGAAVSAMRRNMFAEISRKEQQASKKQAI